MRQSMPNVSRQTTARAFGRAAALAVVTGVMLSASVLPVFADSLWNDTSPANLYIDRRPNFIIGGLVTITVNERLQSSLDARTLGNKQVQNDHKFQIPDFGALFGQPSGGPAGQAQNLKLTNQTLFNGQGTTVRNGLLTFDITATIEDILPNGNLIASGLFTNAGGVPANRIARWNGSAWSSLGSGLNGTASALTTLPSGDLIAGGGFTTAVGIVAPYLARWGCQPPAACNPADLANTDGEPGADGAVDNGDFNAFFIAFFATEGDPLRAAADISSTDGDTVLTGGGPDGTVDNGDFNAFFLYFFQGCP